MRLYKIKEYCKVFAIGSIGYSIIEVLWRGFTHWTMSITGGICFVLVYLSNIKLTTKSILKRSFIGSTIITAVEFISGCIINKIFKLNVWDYSKDKFNIMGQICLLYSFLWFLLCIPLVYLCRYINKNIKTGKSALLKIQFKKV